MAGPLFLLGLLLGLLHAAGVAVNTLHILHLSSGRFSSYSDGLEYFFPHAAVVRWAAFAAQAAVWGGVAAAAAACLMRLDQRSTLMATCFVAGAVDLALSGVRVAGFALSMQPGLSLPGYRGDYLILWTVSALTSAAPPLLIGVLLWRARHDTAFATCFASRS